MTAGVTIRPAAPHEWSAALRLTFGHLDAETRLARVAGGLDLIKQGEMDPAGILVALDGEHVVGAMIAAPVPGAGAAVWPPQLAARITPGLADDLARASIDWLK